MATRSPSIDVQAENKQHTAGDGPPATPQADASNTPGAQSAIAGESPGAPELARPHVTLRQFLLAYIYIGSTSIGGRSASYLLQELAERRQWLKREDWLEGMALGLMLPGMVGNNCAMFLGNLLRGPKAAVLALALYSLPGLLIALTFSALIFDVGRPPWADHAIHALSASAFGLFLYVAVRNIPSPRKTHLGPVVAALAFVAYGLLGFSLLPVLVTAGGVSFMLNERARAARAMAVERSHVG